MDYSVLRELDALTKPGTPAFFYPYSKATAGGSRYPSSICTNHRTKVQYPKFRNLFTIAIVLKCREKKRHGISQATSEHLLVWFDKNLTLLSNQYSSLFSSAVPDQIRTDINKSLLLINVKASVFFVQTLFR
jgi:hypothetical protein